MKICLVHFTPLSFLLLQTNISFWNIHAFNVYLKFHKDIKYTFNIRLAKQSQGFMNTN